MKIKITEEMLEEKGVRTLARGETTDEQINYYGWGNLQKPLKIVVVKGYINDWALYVEAMDKDMTYEEVRDYGNKLSNREKIKLLVDCDDKVLGRYRD
jgi:hypothetical protein